MVVKIDRTCSLTSRVAIASVESRRAVIPKSCRDLVTYLARYAATRRGDKRAVGAAPTGSAIAPQLAYVAIEGENVNTDLARSTLNQRGQLARGDRRYPAAGSGTRTGLPTATGGGGAVMVLVTLGGGC